MINTQANSTFAVLSSNIPNVYNLKLKVPYHCVCAYINSISFTLATHKILKYKSSKICKRKPQNSDERNQGKNKQMEKYSMFFIDSQFFLLCSTDSNQNPRI